MNKILADIGSSKLQKSKSQGFSLVELLVAASVFGIIVIAILAFTRESFTLSRSISSQTFLQQELRNTAGLIGSEIERAIYVFPPCGSYTGVTTPAQTANSTSACTIATLATGRVRVTWSTFTFGSSGSTFTGPQGSTTWNVGTASAPILALIVAPRTPSVACYDTSRVLGKEVDPEGCYTFVAYFPIIRKNRTSATPGQEELEIDPNNENQWLLMEYRKTLSANVSTQTVTLDTTSVTIPAVRWQDVGCQFRATVCASNLFVSEDPNVNPVNSVPTIESKSNLLDVKNDDFLSFSARMKATVADLITCSTCVVNGQSQILFDGIEPTTGFSIDYGNLKEIDERGNTLVRLRLRAGFNQGGSKTLIPAQQPLEVFVSPRNLPPKN